MTSSSVTWAAEIVPYHTMSLNLVYKILKAYPFAFIKENLILEHLRQL